ncbi:hypothetical protein O181_039272 [Austropuccinia psidii MF-1]|uniref:HOOK N-terminal domain-containing protein n=1 Tax=Austropuccinia psidii MF-1 TaxID=1389203 RepID=A0A9Q3HCR2_9BASI|nr:hypothetical protein [Austropuccinia psidii MF-1]
MLTINKKNSKSDLALILWLKSLNLSKFHTDHQDDQDQPQEIENHHLIQSSLNTSNNLGQIICDGEILWEILTIIDSSFFRAPRPSSISGGLSEIWVLRFTSFKKMFKLITRYFEEQLKKSFKEFQPLPNLQKIAKDGDLNESILLCMIIVTLTTLACPEEHVPKIQCLPTWAQTALMLGIESISSKLTSTENFGSPHRSRQNEPIQDPLNISNSSSDKNFEDEDETLLQQFHQLQLDYDHLKAEIRLVNQSYQDTTHKLFITEQDLKSTQQELQNLQLDPISTRQHRDEDFNSESDDLNHPNSDHRHPNKRQEYALRAELDQTKIELTNLGSKLDLAELTNEQQTKQIEEMRKKLDELSDVEEINRGLRDQLDEVRHEMERARKLENVIEKYKKKLDESADVRRQLKTLEEQNSDLLDRNTALENDYRKVAAFKPLMEQYKSQIVTLESELSSRKRETDRLQFELDTTRARLQKAEEDRDREGEELALYEERVKELEEENPIHHSRRRRKNVQSEEDGDDLGILDASFDRHVEEETGIIEGIGGELHDAIEGRTMTSLKLEIRKLQREIKILRSSQGEDEVNSNQKYLVLENLLEDANRMKKKYEDDYLKQYRETIILSNQLEEIRSGKSISGDGPEANIALRQRLNETVAELEKLKAEYTELNVTFEQVNNELTIAKSDLHLVGKDQLEMLSSLRDSVSTEKISLSNEVERLKKEQSLLRDQLTMKTEQIQSLLLEKINLQSDSIDQRERMLMRDRGTLGKTGNGGEMSEDGRTRLAVVEQLLKEKEEEQRILKSKLEKARLFIMNQDKLYKESTLGSRDSNALVDGPLANYFETQQALEAEIVALKDLTERQRVQHHEMESRLQKELRLMASAWHNLGQQKLREAIASNRNDQQIDRNGRMMVSKPPIGTLGGTHTTNGNNQNRNDKSSRVSGSLSATKGFGGQLKPQSWVKQQRDRMVNQYALY